MENPIDSLGGYSPWGCKESDMTKWLHTHTHTQNIPGMSFPQLAGPVVSKSFLNQEDKTSPRQFSLLVPILPLAETKASEPLLLCNSSSNIWRHISLHSFSFFCFFKPEQIQIFQHFLMWSDSLTSHHLKEWPLSRFCVLTNILALS